MIPSFIAWLLLVTLAGAVLADAWLPWRDRTDALERIVLTLGLGYAWAVVAGLALNATPWGVRGATFVGATLLLAVVVASAQRWRGAQACGRPSPLDRRAWLAIAAVIAFAALFRLPNLGWSEFQGDEALVLHKAAATIDGRHDAIYVHKKGPAEILITAEVYAVQRRIDEGTARLPFALAMLAGLAALIVVGRGLFGARVGLAAAVILSLNGFFIAFGRVVQYQALVFLFGTLALWCAWRYRHAADDEGNDGAGRWLVLCALFLACGLLSHYDAALVAPAIGYLVVARWRAVPGSLRRERLAVAAGFALGAALLAAFYVPLVRHPYFQSTTLKYLVEVRLGGGGGEGGGAPYNALPKWMGLANFYSSAYYLAALDLLVAAAVTARLVRRWPRAGWAASAFGILAIPALVLRPQWFALTTDPEGRSWAILVVLVLLVLFVLSSLPDPAWTTTALWLAAPFLFYATLVESPRTHFHVVFPALAVMAGGAVVAVLGRGVGESASAVIRASSPASAGEDRRAPARREGAGGGAGALDAALTGSLARGFVVSALVVVGAYSAFYAWMVFVQHDVAYKRGYPDVKVAGAWYPFAELPGSGWFGFPYRARWKTVGAQLRFEGGDYDSNEEPAVTAWYTRGAPRCGDDPRWLFVADDVQDVQPILGEAEARDVPPSDAEIASARFTKVGAIAGSGTPSGIALWRGGVRNAARREWFGANDDDDYMYHAAFAPTFDRALSGPHYDAGLPFDDPLRVVDERRDDEFGREPTLSLRGWRLDAASRNERSAEHEATAWPGHRLVLTLAWSALGPSIPPNAQVFVHLEREGERTIGQADGPLRPPAETVCGAPRALASLAAGEAVQDRRVIDIAPDAPPGAYDLLVGIYDYETGERWMVTAGPPGANRVRLTTVDVIPAEGGP